jgi:hypothetical protein
VPSTAPSFPLSRHARQKFLKPEKQDVHKFSDFTTSMSFFSPAIAPPQY